MMGLMFLTRSGPDFDKAVVNFEKALRLRLADGDLRGVATTRHNLATAHYLNGRPHDALRELEQVIAINRELGDPGRDDDIDLINRLRRLIR